MGPNFPKEKKTIDAHLYFGVQIQFLVITTQKLILFALCIFFYIMDAVNQYRMIQNMIQIQFQYSLYRYIRNVLKQFFLIKRHDGNSEYGIQRVQVPLSPTLSLKKGENRILNPEIVTFSHFKHSTFLTNTLNFESDIFIVTNLQVNQGDMYCSFCDDVSVFSFSFSFK